MCAPELQQAPCLSTTPVGQHSGVLALRGPVSADELLPPAQGPSEMEQVGPAKPVRHAHTADVVLQVPPFMQAEQPDTPHVLAASGAAPSSRVHSCRHHQSSLRCWEGRGLLSSGDDTFIW